MSLRILALALALTTPAVAAPLQLGESVPESTSLDDPDVADAQEIWLAMIQGAESTIDLSQFYVSPKEGKQKGRLQPVLDAIDAAAKRGVTVRFLIDAKFAKTYPDTLVQLEKNASVEVRRLDLKHHTGGVQHAKYFVVDGKVGWLGSQNFDWRSLQHITELGVRLEDPTVVGDLHKVFEVDWALAGGAANMTEAGASESPEVEREGPTTKLSYKDGDVEAILVASPKSMLPEGVDWDLPYIIAAIDSARHRVRAQVMTYALIGYDKKYWDALDTALRRAAARGVEVQFIVADWSLHKKKQEALKSLQVMSHVEVRVMSIPQIEGEEFVEFGRVAHAKYLVVDGTWAWVGTSNWSRDYFYGSRNVGVVVDGGTFGADLDVWFERMWNSEYAETIDPAKSYRAPARQEKKKK